MYKRLFAITGRQLSFGVERDILVDDLDYYFEFDLAADIPEFDENAGGESSRLSSRDKARIALKEIVWLITG